MLILAAASGAVSAGAEANYREPKVLAHVKIPHLTESSGLAASHRHPGIFWTHNDSGGGTWIYALDRAGRSQGRFAVRGARSYDWEDISLGPCAPAQACLYIGDIGDNDRKRPYVTVYRIPEPAPGKDGITAAAEAFRFRYPDGPHDAEALMVHPKSGDLYIVTKARGADGKTLVFKARAPLKAGPATVLTQIATLDLDDESILTLLVGRITGGAISPDGTKVALCDYLAGWEADVPARAKSFDEVWKAKFRRVNVGKRAQGESITYRPDGKALLMTSEGPEFDLIEVER